MAVNGLSTYGMLNNAQETMFMKWSNGTIAQEIEWRNAEPGYSYCEDSTNPNATWVYVYAQLQEMQYPCYPTTSANF